MFKFKSLIAAALIAPVAAFAAVSPGEYTLANPDGGSEGICFVADGTWYSTTFAGWGGRWNVMGKFTYIRGNWGGDTGNNTVEIKKGVGTWQEWTDGFGFDVVWAGSTLTRISSTCSAAATTRKGAVPGAQQ